MIRPPIFPHLRLSGADVEQAIREWIEARHPGYVVDALDVDASDEYEIGADATVAPALQSGSRPGGLGAKPPVGPKRCKDPSCGICAALRQCFGGVENGEGGSSNTPLLGPLRTP